MMSKRRLDVTEANSASGLTLVDAEPVHRHLTYPWTLT